MERRNGMKIIVFLIVFNLIFLFAGGLVRADIIHLKGGREFKGKIVEETDKLIKVKVKSGIVSFPKNQVESIEELGVEEESYLSNRELYKKKLSEIDQYSAQDHLDLGDFAYEANLLDEAETQYKQVIELDPAYEELAQAKLNEIYEKKAMGNYRLALVFYESNNFTKARQSIEDILNNYPQTLTAKEAQELLGKIQKKSHKKILPEKEIAKLIIVVPVDFKTLGEAIENATPGGTIFIQAGTYNEDKIILKNSLTIRGEGAGNTTLIIGEAGIKLCSKSKEPLASINVEDIKIYLKGSPIFLENTREVNFKKCVITGINRAFYISKSIDINITNCTIADMMEGICTGFAPVGLVIRNSIIANNKKYGIIVRNKVKAKIDKKRIIPTNPYTGGGLSSADETEEDSQEQEITDIKLYYNDVWGSFYNYHGIAPGQNDISEDPQFISADDYHLKPASPCIDAGDPDSKYYDSDGSRADIGALPCLTLEEEKP